jgi:hypothetical protein
MQWPQLSRERTEMQENSCKRLMAHGALAINSGRKKIVGPGRHPQRPFFIPPRTGPHRAPKRDAVRDQVIAMRKQNFSIDDSSEALKTQGHSLSPVAISLL